MTIIAYAVYYIFIVPCVWMIRVLDWWRYERRALPPIPSTKGR